LDEDEDLKAMMDKKATSKIQKEIKLLEKAKTKIEKIMGKGKGKKKEVIDEMEDTEDNPEFEKAAIRAEEMYNNGLEIEDIVSKFNPSMRNDLERHLRMGFEGSDND
jgi:Spy/CpxP family protein refolding chaperone